MLSKIEKLVACVCVSIMAVLVFVNVIARYVFGNSLAVSDEMSTYLFVLMSFMGVDPESSAGILAVISL